MNLNQINKFVNFITEGYEQKSLFWEIRLINKVGKIKQLFFKNVEKLKKYFEKNYLKNWNCYLGILPRTKLKGSSEAIEFGNVFFTDLDSERAIIEKDKIYQKLCELNLRPSLMVNSGHGIHCYFKLKECIKIERWKQTQEKLVLFFKKHFPEFNPDIAIKDPARVMRIIGTLNVKDPTNPIQTEILFEDYTTYKVEDIEKILKDIELPKKEIIELETKQVSEEELNKLLEKDQKLRDLLEGNWQKYGFKSRSEAEESLITKLVQYGITKEQIFAIMNQSKIGKWHEKPIQYKNLTYEKALKFAAEHQTERIKEEAILKLKTDRATYELLKSDGITVSHAGWFLATDEKINCGELFYAYTKIKKEESEFENIEPFVLIFEYDKDGNILSRSFKPLSEFNVIELGKIIAKVNKKSIGESSLSTQIELETVAKLLNENPIVNLQELYTRIKEKFLHYISFDDEIYADIVVLWAIATYFSDVFKVFPNLFLLGSSGSGKTRLTKLIVFTSRRGWMIADPTDANLPRIIDGYRPTLGLDDFDVVMRRHFPIVLSLLKHVYKESIQIPRLEKVLKGNKFLLSLFSPYTPLVMNSIEPIAETQLITRYIRVDMSKSKKKFPRSDPDVWYTQKERQELYTARFLFAPKVFEIFSHIDTGLVGRDDEIWSPILTIAKLISDDLFEKVKEFAIKESKKKEEELYPEEKLIIEAIEKLIGSEEIVEFTAGQLLDVIHDILIERKEITEKAFEKEWNTRKLGKILERMHIPKKQTKERLRVVDKLLLKKLKETYGFTDITDITDVNIVHTQENKPSKNEDLSQNKPVFEEKNIDRHAIVTSVTSVTSKTSVNAICEYCGKYANCFKVNDRFVCEECLKEEKVERERISTI
jgi:hypothetical protein